METPPNADGVAPPLDRTVVAGRRRPLLRGAELGQYRDLLYFLTRRHVLARYKQTALGAAWAVLQPLLAMVIFSVIFGRVVGIKSEGIPYPLFAYAALVAWTFHSTAVTQAATSLIQNERIIAILPLS